MAHGDSWVPQVKSALADVVSNGADDVTVSCCGDVRR